MSVERANAVINNEIILRINFRFSQTGDLFDPNSITKIEILDSDAVTVLETITGANIVKDSTGKYHVIATAISTPKTIYDKWYFVPAPGANTLTRTNSCIVWKVAAEGEINRILTDLEYKNIIRDKLGLSSDILSDATIDRMDGVKLAEQQIIDRLVAAELNYITILAGAQITYLKMATIYCTCALLSRDYGQGTLRSERLPDYQYEAFQVDMGKREKDFWDKVDENLCKITGYTVDKKLIERIEGHTEITEATSGTSSPY